LPSLPAPYILTSAFYIFTTSLQASAIISYINTHSLLSHTARIGSTLFSRLSELFASSPIISGLRGKDRGTFIAWDLETAELRDKFVARMRKEGVLMGGCGEKSVRPAPHQQIFDSP
jgi:4-aminobutyrate aminotransferase/(S)-3-amino-2-methylpropionate transaminase